MLGLTGDDEFEDVIPARTSHISEKGAAYTGPGLVGSVAGGCRRGTYTVGVCRTPHPQHLFLINQQCRLPPGDNSSRIVPFSNLYCSNSLFV